jgi:hypothetical protein
MVRLLLCLPICLCLAPEDLPVRCGPTPAAPAVPLADVCDNGGKLPTNEEMARLARTDPVAFLENCLLRYNREVKGYRTLFRKTERIQGKLRPSELVAVDFREDPFSVRFDWKEGAGLAQRVLWVKGENNDKLMVKPRGLAALAGIVERDVDGAEAKQSGRYPISEFGMKIGTQRTLDAWIAARKENALHVEFLGEQKVKELGGRTCWVLKRTGYKKAEDDGITELTIFVDKETWLQTGSICKGPRDTLVAEYWFGEVQLNPDFPAKTFTVEGLKK